MKVQLYNACKCTERSHVAKVRQLVAREYTVRLFVEAHDNTTHGTPKTAKQTSPRQEKIKKN